MESNDVKAIESLMRFGDSPIFEARKSPRP